MNVFDLQAVLTLDSKDYENGLNAAGILAKKKGNGIGTALKNVAKVAAAAITAAAGAVAYITKESVSAYAQYEQLAGGVQKLFGEEAQGVMMEYAHNAWKTAGMSANQYMEISTSFAASLIQSLGGDTVEAARVADVAMQAMSDNVNTFGSNMEDVQNAFQGFAKQNYTMLDNLKLGYGKQLNIFLP